MVCAGEQVEQSFDLGDGEGDETGVSRWLLVGPDRQDRLWCLGLVLCGGDSADSESGHDQHDMAV
jgi:hypothetical protein